jgi:hypothetical protein
MLTYMSGRELNKLFRFTVLPHKICMFRVSMEEQRARQQAEAGQGTDTYRNINPHRMDSNASTAYQRHVFWGLPVLFSKLKQLCRILVKNRKKSNLKSQSFSITDLNPISPFD